MKRRVGQKIDPLTNEVFIKSSYDPDTQTSSPDENADIEENEDDDDDDEQDDDDLSKEIDEFAEDLVSVQ